MSKPLSPEVIAEVARVEKILAAEGLSAGEFDHDVARKAVFKPDKGDYFAQAQAFLEEHAFGSRWDRRCWELHASGLSNRKIVGRIKGAYRKKVNLTIVRLRKLMRGRLSGKTRGRPGQLGYGAESRVLAVRLNEVDQGALMHVQDRARALGKPVPAWRDIVRVAIRAFARGA